MFVFGGEIMKIMPLGDRLVLKKIEEKETRLASGLYIPESAKEKSQIGEVIAVGDDDKIKVKVGDRVLYDKYSGSEVEVDNEKYLVIQYKDILAKIE